jgi:hypothetical protein
MPKYVLLGATGSTGSAVLRSILSDPPPNIQLEIIVRSERRLLQRFPDLRDAIQNVNILEGQCTDPAVLRNCCADATTIFACVGANESKPGMSLVYDTANAIVTALQAVQDEQGTTYQAPTVVQLRTASLNHEMCRRSPVWVTSFVKWGMHHLYLDISKACSLYESYAAPKNSEEDDSSSPGKRPLLKYIYADPPTVHDADGVECTGYKLLVLDKEYPTAISYADLGAGMYELGRRQAEFANQALGVVATVKPKETWGALSIAWLGVLRDRIWGLITQGI